MTLDFPFEASLKNIAPVSNSYLILELTKPSGFVFTAGQHVTLQLEDEAGKFNRTYSIASPPSLATRLEFCIQVEADARSSALLRRLSKSALLKMTAPRGDFRVLDSSKTLVFIAGGSGISPLRSMMLELFATQRQAQPIHLIYGCKAASGIPFLEELNRMSQERKTQSQSFYPLFYAESQETDSIKVPKPPAQVRTGRVTDGFALQPSLLTDATHFYLCGPAPMIHSVRQLLSEKGIKPDQLQFERFG